ncbi:RNA polymerase subunit sigma-24 [Paenibacillus sp. 598K]|uniref:RNA polymerase sigma factor n=1 Tax=Paenibacillus sp. 598K TaxID=1117987 RepID=UPI000FF944CB|nr:sigma-70 family RNA polymerase sigma factor [Paenibacillus sp. 598K]GBF78491.1 RNA polymerase subunit sigma-24 [Paenibacillus sp. 598K]
MFLLFLTIEDDSDRELLTSLYEQYHPLLKYKVYEITHDYMVVEDLIQEAFLKLIPKISLLRSLACYKMVAYLVYTVRNASIDYVRKRNRRAKRAYSGLTDDFADQVPDLLAATEENYIKQERFEELAQALYQLSEKDRTLLFLKYNMEMDDRGIAKRLEIPVQHIRQYVARARSRVLRLLRGDGHEKE